MLRYLADKDLDNRIVRGMRRAAPDIDFVRAQDVRLGAQGDDLVLIHAADAGRLVVTHDVSTMTAAAIRRTQRGESSPGVIVVPQTLSIGRAIDELIVIAAASEPDEWRDQILYLPL